MVSLLADEGGNDRWRAVWQAGGGAGEKLGLVAFDGYEEIRAVVLIGLAHGLLAGMERVKHEQLAV